MGKNNSKKPCALTEFEITRRRMTKLDFQMKKKSEHNKANKTAEK